MNILLTVAYEGTVYSGWQRQKNGETVQAALETALSKLFKTEITVNGTSRTDTGVHALAQGAAFNVEKTNIPLQKMPEVINSLLPHDIVVSKAVEAPEGFNPRFNAIKKTYTYKILNQKYKNPLLRNSCWHISHLLDVAKMQEATSFFVGTYDFKAFSATGSPRSSTVRTIFDLSVCKNELENIITISVTGDGFLYNMVRIIAGTLAYVGSGKISPSSIPEIINKGERKNAGQTAPACGLTLAAVEYSGI